MMNIYKKLISKKCDYDVCFPPNIIWSYMYVYGLCVRGDIIFLHLLCIGKKRTGKRYIHLAAEDMMQFYCLFIYNGKSLKTLYSCL